MKQRWNPVGSTGSHFVQIIRVRPSLKIIWDWITWDTKVRNHDLEVQQRLLLEPHPLFEAMIFACCKCTESPALVHMHAIIAIYSLLRATPINLLLLQKFYSCSMPGNIHVQQTDSLYETTSTYTSHVLVSASLQVATPTNPSRYLFAYHEYIGTCNALLTQSVPQFTNPVTSGSAVVTRFQHWYET